MSLFVNQQNSRSELQEKIATELREKVKKTQEADGLFDGAKDIKYLEGTKKTTTLAPAWILIIIMAVIVVGMFLMQGR